MGPKLKLAGYTFLNARIASMILPVGVVGFLADSPGWLTWVAGGMLVLGLAGEGFTAYAHGSAALLAEQMQARHEHQLVSEMAADAEAWANGGWLYGSEGEAEGEDPDEGGTTVSAER